MLATSALLVTTRAPAAGTAVAPPRGSYSQQAPSWAAPHPPPTPAPGYHPERRYHAGLLIPGVLITIVGGIFLTSGLSGSASREEDFRRAREPGNATTLEQAVREHEFDDTFTSIGVAHLTVGLPLLALGILFPRQVLVPNHSAVALAPVIISDRVGGVLFVSF